MERQQTKPECGNVVIAPYYEDIASTRFCQELSDVLNAEDRVIIVDDGSVTRPFDIDLLAQHKLRGHVVRLTRNVGHQMAIACGISVALNRWQFQTLTVLDSDGEDRPADISTLVELVTTQTDPSQDSADIAVATRKSRIESLRFKLFYWFYQLIFKLFVGRVIRFGNFMAMTPRSASRLAKSRETGMHLAASAMNSRLQIIEQPLDRGGRYAGRSRMNLVSLTLHGLRSVMVFAENVLVRITLFCAATAVVILGTMMAMVVIKLLGLAIPGWFSTVSGILLLLLLQVGLVALLVLLSAGNLRAASTGPFDYNHIIESVDDVH